MSDAAEIVIRATNLRKVYRLYAKPMYRFRDMFGLLGDKASAYTEHAALDGIDLEIRRGEKVAVIGRNGAGKSTFLKLVTKVIDPTAGSLDVKGDVHALLQIGTGFHPDFTGRENAHAYLAQLGITGAVAESKCAEAIEFAELEEYIDQPVKTYSTGMAVRLMFSVATAITPDLLVLDEVLGVGDAYFSHKSFDRMRDLCERDGATLLLVTHDVYSAAKLCNRMVWIDRGTIVMDGDPTAVVKGYEESIRLQEEHRLRVKNQSQLKGRPATATAGEPSLLTIEFQGPGARPQPSPVYFSRISLVSEGREIAQLPLADDAFEHHRHSHLIGEASCWGERVEWEQRVARPMLNYGSPFHKVSGVFAIAPEVETLLTNAQIVADCWSEEACTLSVRVIRGQRVVELSSLSTTARQWSTSFIPYSCSRGVEEYVAVGVASGVQGAGDIVVTDFAMFEASGLKAFAVGHGEPVTFRGHYEIRRKGLCERAQVFIIISRNHTERVCKFMTSDLLFDEASQREGPFEMHLRRMMLGAGTYSVAIEIAAPGYSDDGFVKFFSIDPKVYYCATYAFEFTVTTRGWIGAGTIFEGEGDWRLE